MAAQPARHLHVIDAETGERFDECPTCATKEIELKGLQRDIRAWIKRYDELKRDKEQEAREDALWPQAVRVFQAWQTATAQVRREAGEKRSATARENAEFNGDRFFLIQPYLKNTKKYGSEFCMRAVAGIAYDHFHTRRRNGSRKRFDEWERCFKDAREVEERANAAPKDWREREPFAQALDSIKLLTA
jgi:hypothetical protein